MQNSIERVIVGNLVVHPAMRDFLKKSCYHMSYDAEYETITLCGNDGRGGQVLMEVRVASHENAVKLAEHLALKRDNNHFWSRWNPHITIGHDGSEAADKLHLEAVKLGIPCRIRQSEKLELLDDQCCYTAAGGWTFEKMIGIIRTLGERYRKQLATTP